MYRFQPIQRLHLGQVIPLDLRKVASEHAEEAYDSLCSVPVPGSELVLGWIVPCPNAGVLNLSHGNQIITWQRTLTLSADEFIHFFWFAGSV